MLGVLICEDDAQMLEYLTREVRRILSANGIDAKIAAYRNGDGLTDHILSHCDIALLDIDLENATKNGMDIARSLRALRENAVILFVTNYIEYAPEGYEVRAFRYILKNRLERDLEPDLLAAVALLRSHNDVYKLQVNGEIMDVLVKDIMYLEVMHHSVTVSVKDAKCTKQYCIYASLSDVERELAPLGFLRIHKSYLVNMRHLRKLQCREALLDDGTLLPVSEKNYRDSKQKYLLWRGVQ